MISMCGEYKIAIWGFANGKLRHMCPMYEIHRPLDYIRVMDDFLYFVFEQGESTFFTIKYNELYNIPFDR